MSERLREVILRDERAAVGRRADAEATAVAEQQRHAALLAEVGRLASSAQLVAFAEQLRGEHGG